MTTASWAICPACGAVTGSPETHAAWHATLAAGLDPTGAPTTVTGTQWPEATPVTEAPPPPDAETLAMLHAIVTRGQEYLAQVPHGLALLDGVLAQIPEGIALADAYPALPAPTAAAAIAQVRTLTIVQRATLAALRTAVTVDRAALEAIRDLITATMWRAKEDQ